MATPQVQLLSHIHDELDCRIRGMRSWSMVEIAAERWFQVEVGERDRRSYKSYIVPNIEEAVSWAKNLQHKFRVDLRVYARLPATNFEGYILQTIKQVFLSKEARHIYLLESGMVLCDLPDAPLGSITLVDARELYARR